MHWIWRCVFLLLFTACGTAEEKQEGHSKGTDNQEKSEYALTKGDWSFYMKIDSSTTLPFTVQIDEKNSALSVTIINDSEELVAEKVRVTEDSLVFKMPIFRSVFKAAIHSTDSISGVWANLSKGDDYVVPFYASSGSVRRFKDYNCSGKTTSYAGKYEVTFSPGTEDEYKALGVFKQDDESVTGTFITETGDYRFLEGNVNCDSLLLSTFDGSHAFLFSAKQHGDSIKGSFFSGKHWYEPWVAVKNESFKLRHPDSLTYLKEGYETLSFSLPDLDSNIVTYPADEYDGKVVIVQLIGSWCPNCMDETKMYSSLFDKYHSKGLEMLSLGFEAQREFKDAAESLSNLKEYFGADYPFLVAGYANKKEAGEVLPMLNHVMSFPTCVFIDRSGRVRKISTGFYGPGTGDYYTRYKENTEAFIQKLLSE